MSGLSPYSLRMTDGERNGARNRARRHNRADDPAGRAADAPRRPWRQSPFLPATVLVLIVSAAAGLFTGSYIYAMADPAPRNIPTAVVFPTDPPADVAERHRAFVQGMERALDSSLRPRRYRTTDEARQAVERQQVFAVLRPQRDGDIALDVSSASGASVAELLTRTAPRVAQRVGVRLRMHDLNPLAEGDPRGLALFYMSLAAVITGFVGSIQMSVHARDLTPGERIAFTAGYAVLGGLCITAVVDGLLHAVPLPFPHSWLILALTMFASAMVYAMFNVLIGRWALLPTWGLMVMLGNPSSGGAVSWPLLPSVLGALGRWLPPGASVNAHHTAVYFSQHLQPQPYVVLVGWGALASAVFWLRRHRFPGRR